MPSDPHPNFRLLAIKTTEIKQALKYYVLLQHVKRFCGINIKEWYPRGLQISLHIRSQGLQDYDRGRGYFGVNFGHLKSEVFQKGGVFWSKLWSSQI